MWIVKKIHSIILSLTCHSLGNFSTLLHSPSYPFVNSSEPYQVLFLEFFCEFESFIKGWMWIGKKFTQQFYLVIPYKTFPQSYTSPHIHSWIFKTLQLIITWVWVIHKRSNVNWNKIHSIILSVTCHSLGNFPTFIQSTSYPFVNFQNPRSGVGWVMKGWSTVGWVMQWWGCVRWAESCRGGVGHTGVGWVGSCSKTT